MLQVKRPWGILLGVRHLLLMKLTRENTMKESFWLKEQKKRKNK
jgi:hypothetical protein